jgi:hypothetical protein
MSNTELIDRYLHAVKGWLPRKQQKDIVAELAEDLHAQIEDRESALGHPLEEADIVALLKQRGSPIRVASGFIPEQRIINPAMLPLYRMVLKIVLLWVLTPIFVLVFLGPVFGSPHPVRAIAIFFAETLRTVFYVIGIVTVAFALMDRYHASWVDKWDPRKLPVVPPPQQTMQWYNDFAGFAYGMGAFIFWGVLMWQRTGFDFNGGTHVILAPVWGVIYWPILGLALVRAFVDLYCFVRRGWTPARSWIRLGLDAAGMAMALLLLGVNNWLEIVGPHITPADAAKVFSWVNNTAQVTLICCAIIPLFDVVKQVRLLRRASKNRTAQILAV